MWAEFIASNLNTTQQQNVWMSTFLRYFYRQAAENNFFCTLIVLLYYLTTIQKPATFTYISPEEKGICTRTFVKIKYISVDDNANFSYCKKIRHCLFCRYQSCITTLICHYQSCTLCTVGKIDLKTTLPIKAK